MIKFLLFIFSKKIIDFGLATNFQPGTPLRGALAEVGSRGFMSPQVLNCQDWKSCGYTEKLGVVKSIQPTSIQTTQSNGLHGDECLRMACVCIIGWIYLYRYEHP